MSKVTKKELKSRLDGVQNRFAALVKDLKASGYICESVYAPFAHDYDATNWQNSLIERDIAKELAEIDLSELTGSELCRAILKNQVYQPCFVSDVSEAHAIERKQTAMIDKIYSGLPFLFRSGCNGWSYVIPINNKGEPLTASEVGL